MNIRLRSRFALAFFYASISGTLLSQTYKPGYDSPLDGQVNAIAVNDSTVYVGGTFTKMGYYCGNGVLLDTSTAQPNRSFPKFMDPSDGRILVAISDNNGGWYMGGQFTYVNGQQRKYLAHVRSDGSLDPWNPSPNSFVYALGLQGNHLYVGGYFTNIAGQSRGYAAAFDTTTGSLLSWDPKADNFVIALLPVGNKVYLGGYFTYLNTDLRFRIGCVDSSTAAATSWNPNPSVSGSGANKFLLTGSNIYVCGSFTNFYGYHRLGLVKLDLAGNVDAAWHPDTTLAGAGITCLAAAGNNIYVGGSFTNIGFTARNNLAAIDASSGLVTSWNPNPSGNVSNDVTALATANGQVWVAGFFGTIGGKSRSYLAAIDTGTGLASTFNANINEVPLGLVVQNGNVFAGGRFSSVLSIPRSKLAAIDLSTGMTTSWNPNPNATVYALAYSGGRVFAGGDFTTIGGGSHAYLAALDTNSGNAATWSGVAGGGSVYSLMVMGTRLYVGGAFTVMNSASHGGIAALDLQSGAVKGWSPSFDIKGVTCLAASGSTVYAGGYFTQVNSNSRSYAAAFDTTTDSLTDWAPTLDNNPDALAADDTTVYIGGSLFNVGGQKSIVRVNGTTGALESTFNANFTLAYDVHAIALTTNGLYIGGNFSTVNSQTRPYLAVLDATSGSVSSWNSAIQGGPIQAIAVSPQMVLAGGFLGSVLYYPQSQLIVLTDPLVEPLPVELTQFEVAVHAGVVELSWTTATETDCYGFAVERRTVLDDASRTSAAWAEIGFVRGSGTSSKPQQYTFVDRTLPAGSYAYRIKQVDQDGSFKYSSIIHADIALPKVFSLHQNYPNPFNPTTTIQFSIAKSSMVNLKIFDLLGREVETLVDGPMEAGTHEVTFDATRFASGIYFYRLKAGSFTATKRLVLLK